MKSKDISKNRRMRRVRAKIAGTSKRPRLSVYRSLRYIYAQIVDDGSGKILASVDSRKMKKAKNDAGTAGKIGEEIARLAAAKKIVAVVFDKRGYKYHGKVKALAEGARKGGLKF